MGVVKDGHSLVRESGAVRWDGGSRLFGGRFSSANSRVTIGRVNVGTAEVGIGPSEGRR